MGKPKKDRKNRQDDEFGDDDVDLDPLANLGTSENQDIAAAPKLSKKDRKKNKHKDDDDDDDVVTKMESLSMENEEVNGDSTNSSKKDKKTKKKSTTKAEAESDEDSEIDLDSIAYAAPEPTSKGRKVAAGFDMLAALEDEMQSNEDDSDSELKTQTEKVTEEVVLTPVDNAPSNKKDKKKKKDKKVKEEEADIDAILASLDKPKEKTSKKSKKEKKRAAELAEAEEEKADLEESEMEKTAEANTETITQTVEPKVVSMEDLDDEEDDTKKKKKKAKKKEKSEAVEGEGNEEEGEEGGTVKTAAQKKKEKKEREKKKKEQQRLQNKKKEGTPASDTPEDSKEGVTREDSVPGDDTQEASGKNIEDDEESKTKTKKKKGKDEKETKKKGPSKQIAALKEHLKKVQEEEERARLEEEEKERKLEEARLQREEQKRLEEERKQRKKQKEKERVERLKAEGKFLTAKQKQDKKRAMQMLELMKAQGVDVPNKDELPKKRPVYGKKKKPVQRQDSKEESEKSPSPVEEIEKESSPETPPGSEEPVEKVDNDLKDSWEDDVKDSWDVSDEEEESEGTAKKVEVSVKPKGSKKVQDEDNKEESEESESEEEEEEEEEGSSEESSTEESSEDEDMDALDRARLKIEKRRQMAESKRSTDVLRAPVVCVLGHVDTGKTKILDKLRRTNVQDGEAGGITQQIGATNVPHEAIRDKTSMCKEFQKNELKLPGLLIIDTPGHESFSNLRSRGSSLCDIAILVVDIMHGLEPQTIESINLLKSRKTPFVVALNKIDRLYQWKANPNSDVVNTLKKQHQNTKLEFEERTRDIVVQFAEQSLNVALFHENKNPREYISLVPTSAHSGDGMGNLVALICELSQDLLARRVSYSEELQATVMEVKAIHGLGTTIDVILVNGRIREGQTIVTAGTEGPIVTQIRGLLMPQPMKELRVKNQYEKHKEVKAAQGVKVIAKDLEKALAGLPLYVAHDADETEFYKEEVSRTFKAVLSSIKLSERGVFVQASTLGSLEALLEFLRTSKIPYAGIGIGPVHKRDIMKASIMLEHDNQYAVILAFDVKIEREAQELADSLGVRVFSADIIYHLFDKFMAYRDELKKQRQDEFKHLAVFPTKLRILPQYIFNTRDPIVVGVIVEAGFVKEGTPLCVPTKDFVEIGRVTSVEFNHKQVEVARKGQEVCVKIEPIGGETPKLYGRHFDHTDLLVSKISRQSIDTVKDYFREEMTKPDWQLIMELKKMFQII